ncbi:PKD domain-containing protein [bacterium]|nr:PKD domain-containing protein [bacterium]
MNSIFNKVFFSAVLIAMSFSAPILAESGPMTPFLNNAFPDTVPGSSPDADWATQNAFPNLTFMEPTRIIEHPTQSKFFIVSKDGQVNVIDDNPAANTKTLFLDLRGQVRTPTVGEGGLSGLVFHPEYGDPVSPNRGYVYVWYRAPSGGTDDGYQRLSRFTVPDGASSVDPSSEFIMIQQYDRSPNHGGGSMFFGPDGFLYLGVGDEGNCCDRTLSTQRLDLGLFSGVLRIDVDQDPDRSHPIIRQPLDPAAPPATWESSYSQGYYIPNENPFNDPSGANLEEFYSIGLRHPWVISYDSDTGNIWTGDVGQNEIEEVDIIFKGANHQWAYKEGSLPGMIPTPATIIGTEAPPIWEYDHSVGFAIIGAGVYRGDLYPELFGKYLFSDFVGGQLWALQQTVNGSADVVKIADVPGGFGGGINAYAMTRDGRILMAQTAGGLNPGGTILELVPQSGAVVTAQPPALLSQTAAFKDLQALTPQTGCIPYDMNVPFWSDAAIKTRWMCVPNDGAHDTLDEQIIFSENGEWQFPVGAVLMKHFEMEMDEVNPGTQKRLETRFLVHANDGYYGVTYKWRADGSDADLLLTSFEEDLTIETATGPRIETWHYPSRTECMRCHTSNAGGVIGPNTRQLNGDYHYPDTAAPVNQLSTLNGLGIFSPAIIEADIPTFLTSTPTNDTSASLTARARSYLDSNCQYCHRPGGVRANFDARLTTPLVDQGLINAPLNEPSGLPGEAIIVPESLTHSALYSRVNATSDMSGMPPLAKDFVDASGVSVLADWIISLGGFTVGNDTTTDAPFLDAHNPSLYINETDVYTNTDGEAVTLTIANFDFFARNVGNPVTPIVVKVNGDNDFTVLAIGSTRTSSEYFQGSNSFPFDDFTERKITLLPGETIATGFMDSFADGSGWGSGTVIPAINSAGEDEIWALLPDPLILASEGFVAGRDTPVIVENESPLVTNAGKAINEYTTLNRSYSFAINFTYGYSSPGGTGGTSSITLGNNGTIDGVNLDTWLSNMLVNESDTYTNSSAEIQQVSIDQFNFYARQLADPVTPYIVRVNADNDFTVLAIGTTRAAYNVGANSVAFSDGGPVLLSLNPGEKIATGFLDANANGSGSGSGAVIPWDEGGDQIWYTGGPLGTDSGSVAVGSAPAQGAFKTLTTLNRSYHYQFVLTVDGNQIPTADAGGPYSGDVGSAILFDGSGSSDPDGDSLAYSWDFGDGSVGSGVVPSHVYATAGTYSVSLIVNDGTFDSSVSIATVVVNANVTLGNDTTTDGVNSDTWLSNMLVNESDTYTNTSGDIQQVNVDQFNFYARQVADPVTPFIVLVNADNDFTVVAVGTTRTAYNVGANSVNFSDAGPVVLSLSPGERLATGFLDANADGSGGGSGAVIPWDDGGDELWYTGGPLSSDSGSVAVGSAPLPGAFKTLTTLNRNYHYQITLTTVDNNQIPTAVVGGPYSGVVGTAISFDGSGSSDLDGDPLTYSWTFGDGSVGSGFTPTHVYAAGGTYTVSLTVYDGKTNSPVSSTTAVVNASITLGNNATTDGANSDTWLSNMVVNESDIYTNSSAEIQQVSVEQFNFYARQVADPVTPFIVRVNADNNFTVVAIGTTRTTYSAGANNVAFSDGGAVVISLNPGEKLATGFLDANADGSGGGSGAVIPWDDGGDQIWYTGGKLASDSGSVAVGSAPVPGAFKTLTTLSRSYHYQIVMSASSDTGGSNQVPTAVVGGPYSGVTGTAVAFDGSGSSDLDGDPLTYSWTFGDGSVGNGVTPTHVYATADTYTVTLTVNDTTVDSASSSTTAVITVPSSNQAPTAVVGGPYSGVAGTAVLFDGSGSSDLDGDTLTYSWTFGDGSVGSGIMPTHVYAAGGTYNVSLTVNDTTVNSPVSMTTATISAGTSGSAVTLGNSATTDGANGDTWLSNMLVNETDAYTNISTEIQQVSIEQFNFYARQVADPVTPFIVRVNADNNFTVVAIGTTRTSYSAGANSVAFSDGGAVVISLNPGEKLATGFLDANADGSGGGSGAVIPWDDGGDQIWYTGGKLASDSGSVAVGSAPVPGAFKTLTTLNRNYHYQIAVTVTGGENPTTIFENGSFELDVLPGSNLVTNELTSWSVTSGNVELLSNSVYAAPEGSQTLDLNGTQPGSIRQFAIGMAPSSLHTLYVTYADQASRGSTPILATAEINVNGSQVGTIKTTSDAPFFITCNGYEFMSTSSGTALIDIISTTAGQYGPVIDNVYIAAGGLPQPPESPAIVNGSFETPVVGDPHLCGDQLQGWRVTQENVDVVSSTTWSAFEGSFSLDLGGHGPGGIAQTVTGLIPGQTYNLSFAYARHLLWGTAPLTADVFINNSLAAQLTATTANYSPNWLTMSIPVVVPADGKVTIEFRSTSLDVGGGVIVDDIKLLP